MDKDNTKKIKIEAFMKRCKKLGFLQEKQSCFWNHMDSLQDINIKDDSFESLFNLSPFRSH